MPMEKIAQKYDPLTGLQTTSLLDSEGVLHVNYQQDATANFEAVRNVRNDPDHWRRSVKKDMVHALHIPDGVIMELFKLGINVYTAPFKDVVRALRTLNRYEACDMTGKRIA